MPEPTDGSRAEGHRHPGDPVGAERPDRARASEYEAALSDMLGTGPRGREAEAPPPRPAPGGRRPKLAVVALLLVLAGVGGWSLYDYYLRPVAPPPPESQRRAGRIMLFHAAEAIEAERRAKGAPPANLSGLILPRGNFEYVRADTGYTLRLAMADVLLSYRSGDDVEQLLRDAGVR